MKTKARSQEGGFYQTGGKMRIGILVTIANNFGQKGFYHSQEVGLARELEKRGHVVTVYKWVKKGTNADNSGMNLDVRYIESWSFGVHGYIKDTLIDPDLDVLFSFADNQYFLPHIMKYCQKHQICFIPYSGLLHSVQRNAKSKVMDFIFRHRIRGYYGDMPVLAKTVVAEKAYRDLGFTDITVCPVGMDVSELKFDFLDYDRNALRKELGFSPEDVIVSFVGRMEKLKRPEACVELFEEVVKKGTASYKLIMIGEGPYRERCENLVREKNLQDKVTIIPRVPYTDMWKYHTVADFFWNLWDEEIFGMAILEGIFYCSSVAALSAPGPDTVLPGLEGHKICHSDEDVVQWTLTYKPDLEALKESAQKMLKKCSWSVCAAAIEKRAAQYRQQIGKKE